MYVSAQCSPTVTAGLLCSYPLNFLEANCLWYNIPRSIFPTISLNCFQKKRDKVPIYHNLKCIPLQHLPLPTHFLLDSQLQEQLSLGADDSEMAELTACLPPIWITGRIRCPFHSGHLSSLGTCQCHHSAEPSHWYNPERTAQHSTVQMQHHLLYREGSEPLRNVASTTLNVNQGITHRSFLKASFACILKSKSQYIIQNKQADTRCHLSKALELLASKDTVKSSKELVRD